MLLITVEIIIYAYWYKHLSNFETYKKLVCYVWLYTLGFFAEMPLLRITFHTILFWLLLSLFIFPFITPIVWRMLIYQSKEKKSRRIKLLIWTFIALSLFTVISPFVFRTGRELLIDHYVMEYPKGYGRIGVVFALGLMFMTLCSINIIQDTMSEPEEKKKKRKKKKRKKRA